MGQDLPWMDGLRTRLLENINSKLNVSFFLHDPPRPLTLFSQLGRSFQIFDISAFREVALTFIVSPDQQPLKCCSPVIVEEFARLSHHLKLMYMYVLLSFFFHVCSLFSFFPYINVRLMAFVQRKTLQIELANHDNVQFIPENETR